MSDMGKLVEELTRSGQLVSTAGLRRRFLKVHGDDWDIECEVRQLDGPEFCREA